MIVEDVTVTEMNIGRKDDNYALTDASGETFLAANYTNQEKQYDFVWWDTRHHHYSCPDTPGASP